MMKNRYLALCWATACLLCGAGSLPAQEYTPVPVTISRTVVSMNGRNYYSHIVLARQTLFGITKAYDVTEEDLYEANPSLKETGLKAGTVIYIPVAGQKKTAPAKPAKTETKAQEKPKAEPKPKSEPKVPAGLPDKEGYLQHTVKWFEDIYDIAKAYGVTPQEIMDANALKSSRISKRQVLYVPIRTEEEKAAAAQKAPAKEEAEVPPPVVPDLEDPVLTDPEMVTADPYKPLQVDPLTVDPAARAEQVQEEGDKDEEEDTDGIFDWLTGKGSVEMALLMPFNASGKVSSTNMDFYAGVLMALRDIESEGVKATLNVYDLSTGIPSAFELGRNDFVLGPVSTTDLSSVLERTGGHTPVISPLDQRAATLAGTYGGFIQAPSSAANQYADLAAWAAEDAGTLDRIILVTEKSSAGATAPATGVREALLAQGTAFEGVSWTVAEGRSLPAALTARLTKGGVNRIIVASEKETFVGDVVRNLGILLGRGYQIAMYAPSKVRTFETVDGSAYHQNHLHISSPYFVDYDAPDVKRFVRAYRALYRTDPSQFAFQGYDLTRYFVGLCAKYGNNWTRVLPRVGASGLHTDFRFGKTGTGSWQNTGIRRIIYNPDYSTQLVR